MLLLETTVIGPRGQAFALPPVEHNPEKLIPTNATLRVEGGSARFTFAPGPAPTARRGRKIVEGSPLELDAAIFIENIQLILVGADARLQVTIESDGTRKFSPDEDVQPTFTSEADALDAASHAFAAHAREGARATTRGHMKQLGPEGIVNFSHFGMSYPPPAPASNDVEIAQPTERFKDLSSVFGAGTKPLTYWEKLERGLDPNE